MLIQSGRLSRAVFADGFWRSVRNLSSRTWGEIRHLTSPFSPCVILRTVSRWLRQKAPCRALLWVALGKGVVFWLRPLPRLRIERRFAPRLNRGFAREVSLATIPADPVHSSKVWRNSSKFWLLEKVEIILLRRALNVS